MRWFTLNLRPSLFVVIVLSFSCCFSSLKAQNYVIKQYLEKAGDCAVIYNGELEAPYSFVYYDEFPYYKGKEYVQGEVYFKGKYYPDQRIKLDLYKSQLIILTPETNLGKVVNTEDVEKFVLNGSVFINYLSSVNEKILKSGYYLLVMDGKLFRILGKLQKSPVENSGKATYVFDSKQSYYLLYNDEVYTIKNASTLIKLFPQLKKQLKSYVRENRLDFKVKPEESLYKLVSYCEQIITN